LDGLLRTRLRLTLPAAEANIKATILGHDETIRAVETELVRSTFTFLGICLMLVATSGHPAESRYSKLIRKRFRLLFERGGKKDGTGMATIGTGFLALSRNDPATLEIVQDEYKAEDFLGLIAANGTLVELFRILQYATSVFRGELLNKLDAAITSTLVDKTIAAGRSIGNRNWTLRELAGSAPVFLKRLEQAIGAGPFLRLIAANRTLIELFRILQYASPAFREELLEKLDAAAASALVDKTIAAGRSIGTLHLDMRKLAGSAPDLLKRLEQAIGAGSFLRLTAANGTLFELFRILEYATVAFRGELLEKLDAATTSSLVDKTIAASRSIESLHHILRQHSKPLNQRERLEALIGTEGWWRLLKGVVSALSTV